MTISSEENIEKDNLTSGAEVFVFPASYAQKRMWFLDQFEPNSSYYNIPLAFKLSGKINIPKLKRAFQEIINRHESLRTTFSTEDGECIQIISQESNIDIPVMDLSVQDGKITDEYIQKLADNEARKPFNLSKGRLIRISINVLSSNEILVLVTMHHIISDGWSIGVLFNEIITIYKSYLNEKKSPLEELEIQYVDYSEWQRERVESDELKEQFEYWKNKFETLPPVATLPPDFIRPAVLTNTGSSTNIEFDAEIHDGIKKIAKDSQATEFMVLLASFNILLGKYSGEKDICIGTPIANRLNKESEKIIGLFINTLLLRNDFSDLQKFSEVINVVKSNTISAFENQEVPFEMLVDVLQPDRDTKYSPLFQVMFILQNFSGTNETIDDLSIEMIESELGTSTFDLSISISKTVNSYSVSAEYNSDLYQMETIDSLLVNYRLLLKQVIDNYNIELDNISFITATGKNKILNEWNKQNESFSESQNVISLFEEQVSKYPNNIAIEYFDNGELKKINYSELSLKVDSLTNIINQNEELFTKIAICFDKTPFSIIAILAILKSGNSYIPIDPEYPKERIDYFIKDSEIKTVLTLKNYFSLFENQQLNIITLDDFTLENNQESKPKSRIINTSQIAYQIYTSGSTGKPKGVLISHKSLYNYVESAQKVYGISSNDKALHFASISFDTAVEEIFTTLCSGATLIIRTTEWINTTKGFISKCNENNITVLNFPTAYWHQLLDESKNYSLSFSNILRLVIIGGEKAVHSKVREWYKRYGSRVNLVNTYGPTETTVVATSWELNDNWVSNNRQMEVPIGTNLDNVETYIVDEKLNLLPPGIAGELLIGGDSLATGYNNNARLTSEKFIPNIFSKCIGTRLYRTGDLCKYLNDGTIQYEGRIDNQVKFRGFRIETGEIENTLLENDNVKSASVVFIESELSKILHAFIVTEGEFDLSLLRESVVSKLPNYMVPSSFSKIETIPLTKNGKVDKKKLISLYNKDNIVTYSEKIVSPSNSTERKLAEIWKEVLKIDSVGINQNFFLLGGHSLLAIQILSRITDKFNKEVSLKNFFISPTIKSLAQEIKSLNNVFAVTIPKSESKNNFPLSYSQERLWFLDRMSENSVHYNLPQVIKITGNINIEYLEKSFQFIIEKYSILRTYFLEENGIPFQVISDKIELPIKFLDISNLDKSRIIDEQNKLIKEEVQYKFKLNHLPLMRIMILKITEDEFIITLVMHHIISDEWSLKIFSKEFFEYYSSLITNEYKTTNELEIQYSDYSEWQKAYLSGNLLDEKINYWKNKLNDSLPIIDLQTDYPRPKEQTFNGSYKTFTISNEISSRINNISEEYSISTFVLYLSIFKVLLQKYSNQNEIIVGTPVANRLNKQTEKLIGFFVNTIAVKSYVREEYSFIKLVEKINSDFLSDLEYQDVPFEKVVDSLDGIRDLSISPIFQVMFVFQNKDGNNNKNKSSNSDLKIESIDPPSKTSKFDLTLFIDDDDFNPFGAIEYNTDLFNEETISEMIYHFENIMKSIAQNENTLINEISLIEKSEENRIVKSLNSVGKENKQINFVHEEINKVALAYPDMPALKLNSDNLSYHELINNSNQLANYLISKNVKREDIVGVSIDRSFNLVSSLLAILKCGAAYLPIDPDYPVERIKYMLSDCKVKTIITSERNSYLFEDEKLVINIDKELNEISKENTTFKTVKIDEENIAYIIYTSGSTGSPKGVMVNHKGLRNYLDWCKNNYPITKEYGTVLHATIAFDATVTSIFPALICGAPIQLLDSSSTITELAKVIENSKIGALKITPAHLDLLSVEIGNTKNLENINSFIVGGENLLSQSVRYFQENSNNLKVYNEYGPTETVVGCIVYECSKWKQNGSVPIGRVIPGITIYILNSNLQNVPVGLSGELYISGEGVARGYIGKPELTAERFIPNPFSDEDGSRMYKTGDYVKLQRDGNLIFLGRKDDQIKLRGYRIELSEIESTINQYKYITDSVTDIKYDNNNNPWLIAFAVIKNGNKLNQNDLKTFLKKLLPEYMIPSYIVEIKSIPLTINGKVDRKKLPDINTIEQDSDKVYVPPKDKNERLIGEIWSLLLNKSKISTNDDFFGLGGHSLLVTQLLSRINKEFDTNISIKDIFENRTISEQATLVNLPTRKSKFRNKIKNIDITERIPLTHPQKRLWFLEKINPELGVANIPFSFKVKSELNIDVFNNTISRIVKRHSILRTTFYEVEGVPYQKIENEIKLPISILKIEESDNSLLKHEIDKIIYNESSRIFDLEEGPLFNITLIDTGKEGLIISVVMHHIISDGWSIKIVIKELLSEYIFLLHNNELVLEKNNLQYKDYAVWQNDKEWFNDTKDQLNYWKNKLEDANFILNLPTSFNRPLEKTFNGAHKSFVIEERIQNQLNNISENLNCTMFMVLEGLFSLFLSKYANQGNVLIGSPVANRNNIETESIVGFFANTIVIRNDIDDNLTIAEFLKSTKLNVIEALTNQDLPFETLVEELQPERDFSYTPLFQVMFVLQNSLEENIPKSNMEIETYSIKSKTTQFDLTLNIEVGQSSSVATLEYNTDLFSEEYINTFIRRFSELLSKTSDAENKKIKDITLVSSKELQCLSNHWKFTQTYSEYLLPIHLQFHNIAKKYPNNIALKFHDEELTYSDVEIRSNIIAINLRKSKINYDDVVGVYLSNPLDEVICILGILKAGAAFLMLDNNYPIDRIKFMLNKSLTKLVIIDSSSKIIESNVNTINSYDLFKPVGNQNIKLNELNYRQEQLAYIIFTSGSTGLPKGVMIPHKGISNLVESQISDFNIDKNDIVLKYASSSFDASISEIFMALLSGATLILEHRKNILSPIELAKLIQKENISVITFPPSVLAMLNPHEFKNLKTIISAGEKLSSNAAEKWKTKVELFNAYGPSETSIGATSYLIKNNNYNSIPIGKAISNSQIYILDKNLNHQPMGISGEIFISGFGLARGYVNNPSITAEKFIPDCFTTNSGSRMYRTGDIGRIMEDGNIEYLDRVDDQVKIRGYRIELGEIESKLRNIEFVLNAIVLVNDINNTKSLKAFIIVNKEEHNKIDLIKNILAKTLPEYMIPNYIQFVKTFPITKNGKIDNNKLLQLSDEIVATKKYIEPITLDQKIITSFFKDLLGIDQVSIEDNFFEIGGHSLLVMKLIYKIHERYNIEIPLVSVFQNPTPKALAELVTKNENDDRNLIPLNKSQSDKKLFLIHPSGGSIHWYTTLAEELERELKVFGIQADKYHKSDKNYSIVLIASKYVKIILEEVSEKEIYIGGWSLGVAITIEIAQQLKEIGKTPKGIFLMDQGPTIPIKVENDENLMIVNTFKKSFNLDINELKKMEYSEKMKFILKKAKKNKLVPFWIRVNDFEKYIKLLWLQNKAWQEYQPKKYLGDVNLILSDENNKTHLGWENIIKGNINTIHVSGDHISMLDKNNVSDFANKFMKLIEN